MEDGEPASRPRGSEWIDARALRELEPVLNPFSGAVLHPHDGSVDNLVLFTAIGDGADTVQALAPRRQAAERGIRILCDYLVVIGLLRKEGNRYTLSLDAATFLDRPAPLH